MFKAIPILLFSVVAIPQFSSQSAHAQGKLGVTLADLGNNRGALVTKVENGSAAQKLICPHCNGYHHMTSGVNYITHVNGRLTGTANQVARAIRQSGAQATLTIGNLQKPGTTNYRTQLTFAKVSSKKSYGRNPVSRFGRFFKKMAEANPGGNYSDEEFQIDLDFMNSDDSTDSGASGYSGGLGNNFHLKQQRKQVNRNWSTNPNFGR